jgi:hypothetical protein
MPCLGTRHALPTTLNQGRGGTTQSKCCEMVIVNLLYRITNTLHRALHVSSTKKVRRFSRSVLIWPRLPALSVGTEPGSQAHRLWRSYGKLASISAAHLHRSTGDELRGPSLIVVSWRGGLRLIGPFEVAVPPSGNVTR